MSKFQNETNFFKIFLSSKNIRLFYVEKVSVDNCMEIDKSKFFSVEKVFVDRCMEVEKNHKCFVAK